MIRADIEQGTESLFKMGNNKRVSKSNLPYWEHSDQ